MNIRKNNFMNIKELIKIANEMDRRGLTKEADGLDHIILKLAHDEGLLEGESASEKVRSAIDSISSSCFIVLILLRGLGLGLLIFG